MVLGTFKAVEFIILIQAALTFGIFYCISEISLHIIN
jgi:hypothetical protein